MLLPRGMDALLGGEVARNELTYPSPSEVSYSRILGRAHAIDTGPAYGNPSIELMLLLSCNSAVEQASVDSVLLADILRNL